MPTRWILYIATSLDGYIARSNGAIDWLPAPEAADDGGTYDQFYQSIDALVMGSATYEKVLEFGDWVYAGKPCYVMTRRPLTSERSDVHFLGADVDAAIATINQHQHQRVWLVGGGKLVAEWLDRNAIDEYIITIVPVMLGSGISLYQSTAELPLTLKAARSVGEGMVELHYHKSPVPKSSNS